MPDRDNINVAADLVATYKRSKNGLEFGVLVSVHLLLPFTSEEAELLWEVIDAAHDAGVMKQEAHAEQLRAKVVGFECGHGVPLMENCTHCDEEAKQEEKADVLPPPK